MNKKIPISIIIFLGIIILLLASLFFIFPKSKNNPAATSVSTLSIVSISPTGLPQGSVGVMLRVYGRNLTDKSIINWNGTAMITDTQFVKNGYLATNIPASSFENYGDYPVTVTNEQGNTSNAINFSVVRTLNDILKSVGKNGSSI